MANSGGNAQGGFQQFLTPEAMLTPGIAGSLTMMITNALAQNFGAPRAWAGIGLSFVFGLLVLVSSKSLVQRAVFYVLNSLVIFCVAAGASGIGASTHVEALLPIGPAFAQTKTGPSTDAAIAHCANLSASIATAQKNGASNDQILALVKPCQDVSRVVQENRQTNTNVDTTKRFFAPWKF